MSEVKLRNCPCCGGKSRFVVDHEHVNINCETKIYGYVMCTECGLEQGELLTESEAIEAWNTRKPMEDIVERLEKHKSYNQMMLKKFPKMGTIENAIYKTQRDTYENAIEIVKGGVE